MEYHSSEKPGKEDNNMTDLAIAVLSNAIETLIQENELAVPSIDHLRNTQSATATPCANTESYHHVANTGQNVGYGNSKEVKKVVRPTESVDRVTGANPFWTQSQRYGESSRVGTDVSRKRKKPSVPEDWQRNKAKKLREMGEAYVGRTINKVTGKPEPKLVEGRKLGPRCPCTSEHKTNRCCSFSDAEREDIFKHVWSMSETERRTWVSDVVDTASIKQRTVFHNSRRTVTLVYFFKKNGEKLRVCKTFFMQTTGLRQWWVRAWASDTSKDPFTRRKPSVNSKFEHNRHFCKSFLRKLPCGSYPQSNERTSKHSLGPNFASFADVYRLYKETCAKSNEKALSRQVVHIMFKNMNMSVCDQGKEEEGDDTGLEQDEISKFSSEEDEDYTSDDESEAYNSSPSMSMSSDQQMSEDESIPSSEETKAHLQNLDLRDGNGSDDRHSNLSTFWIQESAERTVLGVDIPRNRKPSHPENWKKNRAKKLREMGEAYVGRTINKETGKLEPKLMEGRKLGPRCPCTPDHRINKCSSFSDAEREELFERIWSMSEPDRRSWVSEVVEAVSIKHRTVFHDSRRSVTLIYFFKKDGERLRVCKSFFLQTTGLRQWWVRTRASNLPERMPSRPRRPSISPKFVIARQFCRDFLKQLPCEPPQHSSGTLSKPKCHLDPTFTTFADVYRLYQQASSESNVRVLCRQVVHGIFDDLNLAIFNPIKDHEDDTHNDQEPDTYFSPVGESTRSLHLLPKISNSDLPINLETGKQIVCNGQVQISGTARIDPQNHDWRGGANAVEGMRNANSFWSGMPGMGTMVGTDDRYKTETVGLANWNTAKVATLQEREESCEDKAKDYVTCTKDSKDIDRRKLGPRCSCSYDHKENKCCHFSEQERQEIFKFVWTMTETQRRVWVSAMVDAMSVKQRAVFHESRRTNTLAYFFSKNGERIKVCKTFFMQTTGLRQWWIRKWALEMPSKNPSAPERSYFSGP